MLRALAWILIALTAAGCSSWQASHLGVAPPAPDRLRLHLRDGSVVTLERPRVEGDSLRGINVPPPEERHLFSGRPEPPRLGRVPRAIALNDIQKVEARRFSPAKSLLMLAFAGGVVYLGLLIAYGISLQGGSD